MSDIWSLMRKRTRSKRLARSFWHVAVAACAFVNAHLVVAVSGGQVTNVSSLSDAFLPSVTPWVILASALAVFSGLYGLTALTVRKIDLDPEYERDITNDRRFMSWNIVESLCKRLGVPTPVVVQQDLGWYGASAVRFFSYWRINVERDTIRAGDYDELETVLAHEISHLVRNDSLTLGLVGVWAAVAVLSSAWAAAGAVLVFFDHLALPAGLLIAVAASLILGAASVLGYFADSRCMELVADIDAATITGRPDTVLHFFGQGDVGRTDWFGSLFRTHPSSEERHVAFRRLMMA